MKSRRFSFGKVIVALILSSKAKIFLSIVGIVIGILFSYDPDIGEFSASKAIAWSVPFLLLGLFIGFLVDLSLNHNDRARKKHGNSFQPEPSDGNGNVD